MLGFSSVFLNGAFFWRDLSGVAFLPAAKRHRQTGGLYLFCTWTRAFLPISQVSRFCSLRSLGNPAPLVDQLPPPPFSLFSST